MSFQDGPNNISYQLLPIFLLLAQVKGHPAKDQSSKADAETTTTQKMIGKKDTICVWDGWRMTNGRGKKKNERKRKLRLTESLGWLGLDMAW